MNFLHDIGKYFLMIKISFSKSCKREILYKQIFKEINDLVLDSIQIVSILSFFIGGVVSIQMALSLENPLLSKTLIGYATRESLILEFSPTMIALILAGKVGSSIASEIGTMRVSEQIDALEIMGINSSAFIIQPKIVASVLFFPFLVVLSMGIGMFGGFLAATVGGIISKSEFLYGLSYWFEPYYIFYALVKTLFFAFAISSISAYFGYYTKGGALAVGKASTKAVVYSSVVVLIINFIVTQLMLS